MKVFNRRFAAMMFLTAVLCRAGFAEDRSANLLPKEKMQRPASLSQVRLGGELGARYAAATCNILTRNDRYPIASFVSSATGKPGALWWDWPGDQIGRWLSVVHVAEGLGWTQSAWYRREVADAVLPLQNEDGHFGPLGATASDDMRIPSGNGFALRGLMDAYADTRDPRYLEAARKSARYFEAIAPTWEKSQNQFFDRSGQPQSFDENAPGWDKREAGKLHEFYGHCLDGLVALYEQTGDAKTLAFAERLAKNAARTPHTHHSLSLCRGLIDLAGATGNESYLAKVEDYLAWCRENRSASGGLPETMPVSPQDEGCALADWIVVNAMMFQLTGDERYLDDAEHTLVNHFFMNQFHTGGFGHLGFSQEIVGGKRWQGWDGRFGSENPGCCSFWGQWALGQIGRFIATQSNDAVSINLYCDAEISLPELDSQIAISGDFPRMTKARIRVETEKPRSFALALRIPPWTRSMKVQCDGVDVELPKNERRATFIMREWSGAATIEIAFKNEVRTAAWPPGKPKGTAIFDGPLCLGLSSDAGNVDLPWAVKIDASGRPILDREGRPLLEEPASREAKPLEPINAKWLKPDANDPARRRILFEIQKAEQ